MKSNAALLGVSTVRGTQLLLQPHGAGDAWRRLCACLSGQGPRLSRPLPPPVRVEFFPLVPNRVTSRTEIRTLPSDVPRPAGDKIMALYESRKSFS